MNTFLLQIAIIGLAGFAAQWGAWRLKVPAIVFLLLTGFVFGPVLHVIRPDALMGGLLRPAIAVAVSIILFEASLNLNLKEIRGFRRSVRHIVLIGGPVSWVLTSWAAHYIGGLSWPTAVTFGGLLIVTGPTVIVPLLRSAHLNSRVGSILKWEGIINDPLGVLYAVLAYEYFSYVYAHPTVHATFFLHFADVLIAVMGASVVAGFVTAYILQRGLVPEYLKSYFLFIVVVALFCACNAAMDEAGFLAVTVLGITVGNRHIASLNEIRKFKETVTLLLVSGVFILLTARMDPALLLNVNLRGFAFILAILFVIRPLAVLASSVGTDMKWREMLMIGWVAPRGIVCAAIAGVMGPELVAAGFPDGDMVLPLAFAIVVVTVLLHSLTVKPLGLRLKLAVENAGGLLIIGATDWSAQFAEVLKDKDIPVLIADSNWHRLKKARLASLPVFYGEILSEEADFTVDHSGFGGLLAATDNGAYNALACNTFAPDFGRERVWQLAGADDVSAERKKVAMTLLGKVFADTALDSDTLSERFAKGDRFKATKIGPQAADADELGILNNPDDIKVGFIRNGILSLRSPDLDSPAREGDILLWFGQPKKADV
jgi:NhaP-type Na+/H+ or K+/H+ antiporter